MKSKLFMLLLCAPLVCGVCASAKTVLPDACGDDSVKFDVKTEKGQPQPVPPRAGKAQIVFVESYDSNVLTIGGGPVARFGVDGAWVGANKGDSYFVLSVDPGLHHVCVSPQTILGRMKKSGTAVDSFTAEVGKTYYYEFKVTLRQHSTMGASGPGVTSGGGGMSQDYSFELGPVSEDEGRYRVKAGKLATSNPN